VSHLAPDAYWQADDLFAQIRTIERLLPSLETFCAEVSSELSGLNVTPVMFRRLGGMWLMHLAHQVSALPLEQDSPGELTQLLIPVDGASQTLLHITDLQFRTQLVRLSSHSRRNQKLTQLPTRQVRAQQPLRRPLGQFAESALQFGRRESAQIFVVQPYLKLSATKRLHAIWRSPRAFSWTELLDVDSAEWTVNFSHRVALANLGTSETFLDRLRSVIPLILPVAYGEGLAMESLRQTGARRRPRMMYSANANQFHLPFQMLSSLWGAKGTLIASHQHGGHQGLDEIHAGEEYEARTSDVHYSLGWTDTRRNIRPLPAAMPQRSNSASRHRLLLMSLSKSDVTYRLQPFCLPKHFELCARETRDFLARLGWPEPAIVRAGNEDLSALQLSTGVKTEGFSVPGSISASASALVVHNYLGVTWLETLAMNVPTVCFIPTGIHKFRAAAQPFVDVLAKVGVIHYSGIEAAKFVNGLNGDPSAWWQSAEVQEAREAFVARYANFSENWLPAWIEEFERLLAE